MFETFENGIGLWNIAKGDGCYARTMQTLRGLCEDLGMSPRFRLGMRQLY